MRRYAFVAVLAILWLSLAPREAAAAVAVSKTALIASTCATCHGPDGRGSKQVPNLQKLSVQDISEILHGFKNGTESSTIMGRHASGYTDEEIKKVARYFADMATADRDPNTIVCKPTTSAGSAIKRKICKTAREWTLPGLAEGSE